jgi:hypothetical protein
MSTYCAEVLPPTRDSGVRVLLIRETVDGFVLDRLNDAGASAGDTQHDTLDEAMHEAYSEYAQISDWRFCPDGADPLEYLRPTAEN